MFSEMNHGFIVDLNGSPDLIFIYKGYI